jgi:hypothetical protein
MAFDQQTRNRLARFVSEARTSLSAEFTRQLQNDFGLNPATGEAAGLDKLSFLDDTQRETARLLRATLDHYLAAGEATPKARRDALDRIVREQAFTVLNRLCALRMAEARGLLIESIGRGYQSKGFQLYTRLAGAGLGETGDAYRCYLFSVFDEFAVDLPVLFDRYSPQGRLFPREAALLALLEAINHADIDPLWAEDETIGWIYQYFNSKEERKAMRDASQAPRNSRELAVRNQFFTPRYVVEFLTDNTLGRIWYEMTQGETALKDTCRYLVRRPNEIFLRPGETADAPAPLPAGGERLGEGQAELTQEELLRQPVYIPHRPMKDPRELKMLDPACGSMHFGLYAFDLFERIYEEAWDREKASGGGEQVSGGGEQGTADTRPLTPLSVEFPDREAFLREVPRLIIEHNIHGIDIDPRAVQIAGLSLWLRAQKRWHDGGVRAGDRPRIRRSNVVCAEPMPGETALLEEFIKQSLSDSGEDRAVAGIVRRVFEAMALAGEAGSLLKIEEEIAGAIEEARQQWLAARAQPRQAALLREAETPYQTALGIDVRGIADEAFWEQAEGRIYDALRAYAEGAEGEGDVQRRLFADDAARGFAFIDLCRQRYDVVLMNPPFGSSTALISDYLETTYPNSKADIAAVIVERGADALLGSGLLGAITTRNLLVLTTYEQWRIDNLLGQKQLVTLADLGYGVLDSAVVEASAFIIGTSSDEDRVFYSCLEAVDKSNNLVNAITDTQLGIARANTYLNQPRRFQGLPSAVISYSTPRKLLTKIIQWSSIKNQGVAAYKGVDTGNDAQFLRLAWEVEAKELSHRGTWRFFAKGGEWNPFWDDLHLLVDWSFSGQKIAVAGGTLRNTDKLFQAGLTYPQRTTSSFGPRVLPRNCVFSTGGIGIIFSKDADPLTYLALLLSRPGQFLVEISLGGGDTSVSGTAARNYTNGMISRLPFPILLKDQSKRLSNLCREMVNLKRSLFKSDETSRDFVPAFGLIASPQEIAKFKQDEWLHLLSIEIDIAKELERLSSSIFEFEDHVSSVAIKNIVGPSVYEYPTASSRLNEIDNLWVLNESEIVQLLIGQRGAGARYVTKNCQLTDRKLELVSHLLEITPSSILSYLQNLKLASFPIEESVNIISVVFGFILGRWDIRLAISKGEADLLPDPFDPLPVCPPGMLQNAQGLPAAPADVPADYPLRIAWGGILCDDAGHPEDIEARVREALRAIWGERADAIEQEACDILGVAALRDYFRKPALFFADHLKRYSKSRRQAPIYWPLSTTSGSYTLWLYYHRLTDQTLYTCVNDFVDPKLRAVSAECAVLGRKAGRSAKEERELEQLTALMRELEDFRAELLRVAAFWKPNLNDGVQITAAPLWRLFGHKPWQKKLRETWEALEAGDYDWAHLAYNIWPARVREKCKADKSLAIAHDLEHVYVAPAASAKRAKKTPARKKKENLTEDMFEEDN